MYNISKIGYKQYGEFTKEVLDDGYFMELEPQSYFGNCNQFVYCHEINIMIKIKNNDENYFDFTTTSIDIDKVLFNIDKMNHYTWTFVQDGDNYVFESIVLKNMISLL